MAEQQLVVFRLGTEQYAIPISQVREIIRYAGATKLPNTPEFLDGVINLRGKVIPVVELAKLFGLSTARKDSYAVIVEMNQKEIGIIVDEVSEVITLQEEAIEPPPAAFTGKSDFVRGVGKDKNRLLILIDLLQIFSQTEIVQFQEAS